MVEVQLAAVRVDLQSKMPVVLLQEREGTRRTLPIFIAPPEATAIAFALQGVVTERPMTHDLIRDLLSTFEVHVQRVLVTELRGTTYYAEIHAELNGRQYTVSSRPSDAIAIAVRTGTPLFVADDLLDAEGVVLENEEDEEETPPEELVDQFREFIQGVRPEDFS